MTGRFAPGFTRSHGAISASVTDGPTRCSDREGWILNHKKVLRLWREEGLKVSARHHKRRRPPQGESVRRAEPPNHVWAIDFQFDATSDGRMLKLANIVDEFTREALSTRPGRTCTADDLVKVLEALVTDRGHRATCDATTDPS